MGRPRKQVVSQVVNSSLVDSGDTKDIIISDLKNQVAKLYHESIDFKNQIGVLIAENIVLQKENESLKEKVRIARKRTGAAESGWNA